MCFDSTDDGAHVCGEPSDPVTDYPNGYTLVDEDGRVIRVVTREDIEAMRAEFEHEPSAPGDWRERQGWNRHPALG
jgi:hypothetical protein